MRRRLRAGGIVSSSSSSRHRGAHLRHDFPEVYSNASAYSFRGKIPRIFLFLVARLLRRERRERERESVTTHKKAHREKPIYIIIRARRRTRRFVRAHRRQIIVVLFIAKTKRSEFCLQSRFDRCAMRTRRRRTTHKERKEKFGKMVRFSRR